MESIRDYWLRMKWFVLGDWWLTRFGQWLCGRGGHAPGVYWYGNPWAPDMRCKRCGRDTG